MNRRIALTAATSFALAALASACAVLPAVPGDVDGDRRGDLTWLDGSAWYRLGAEGRVLVHQLEAGDIPVPGDYDGNGTNDVVVIKADGRWVKADGTVVSTMAKPSAPADFRNPPVLYPVPADYTGDGKVDAAWYRASDGTYFVEGAAPQPFGDGPVKPAYSPGDQDLAVPADYDGDKKADLAVYNPRTGRWKIRESSTGTVVEHAALRNPLAEYVLPVPGDYAGAGRAQPAVAGRSGFVVKGGPTLTITWGNPDMIPSAVDLDGDARVEPIMYDWNAGTWATVGADGQAIAQPLTTVRVTPLTAPWSLTQNIARTTLLFRNCLHNPADC